MNKIVFLMLVLLSTHTAFGELNSYDSYTVRQSEAMPEQRFALVEILTITIPDTIVSTSQAVDYILTDTGYRQANDSVRSPQDTALMSKPIARINRIFHEMTVLAILSAFAGIGYVPVVDPVNRLIAFDATYDFAN